jgi:ribosomal-protein-alanine N-acetyltransferase
MATRAQQRRFDLVPMRPADLDGIMEIERQSFRAPWSRQVFVEELDREWAHVDVLRAREPGAAPVIGRNVAT